MAAQTKTIDLWVKGYEHQRVKNELEAQFELLVDKQNEIVLLRDAIEKAIKDLRTLSGYFACDKVVGELKAVLK